MSRSFGPVVIVDQQTLEISKVHCHWCMFRSHDSAGYYCSHSAHQNNPRIPDPGDTPEWCQMRVGYVQDALDQARGVTHYVIRWSGRKTDAPREIYEGIPSEAARQFRLASRDAKRGTVRLEDANGDTLAMWPEASK